jgi:hypothetical protein
VPTTQQSELSPAARRLILINVGLGQFIAALDARSLNVALPTLSTEFGTTMQVVAWVPLAYQLTVIGLVLSLGRLGALRFCRRQHGLALDLLRQSCRGAGGRCHGVEGDSGKCRGQMDVRHRSGRDDDLALIHGLLDPGVKPGGAAQLRLVDRRTISSVRFISRAIYFSELRAADPVLDLRLFRKRLFTAGMVSLWLISLSQTATFFLLPFYLQGILKFTPI